jgi:hypothetical protein
MEVSLANAKAWEPKVVREFGRLMEVRDVAN